MNPPATALPVQVTEATAVSQTIGLTDGMVGIRIRIPCALLIRLMAGIWASSDTTMLAAAAVRLGLPSTGNTCPGGATEEMIVGAPIAIVRLSVSEARIVFNVRF